MAAPGPEGREVRGPGGGAARVAAQNAPAERPTGPAAAAAARGGEAAGRTGRRRRSACPEPGQQMVPGQRFWVLTGSEPR